MRQTVTIIRTEHRRLAAIINCFIGVLGDVEAQKNEPDFELLELIHDYFRSFLYKFHHPKEDQHLFPALLKVCPELSETIEKLEAEHEKGLVYLENLETSFMAFKENPASGLAAYIDAARTYRDFEWQHMGLEEKEILPVAEEKLPEETWIALDAIFTDHDDPVFGDRPTKKFETLLSKIVNTAPAPHGLAGK
ncbi:MAG: hemerythrin domain-containing protein [Methylocystaceae bacterium]|nr:hemerythrin domain-containing protein [Methylocystaceae bacterium]